MLSYFQDNQTRNTFKNIGIFSQIISSGIEIESFILVEVMKLINPFFVNELQVAQLQFAQLIFSIQFPHKS